MGQLNIENFVEVVQDNGLNTTKNVRFGVSTDRATMKGIYLGATVAVVVPSITDPDSGSVAVDVSAAFTMQPAVGDAVLAVPLAALPTNCVLENAYVTATDQITVSFASTAGNVTGASTNFQFLVIDLT